jgi:hypothetical protein
MAMSLNGALIGMTKISINERNVRTRLMKSGQTRNTLGKSTMWIGVGAIHDQLVKHAPRRGAEETEA